MAILFRKHERLSNLAQNSVKRYILQLYIKRALQKFTRCPTEWLCYPWTYARHPANDVYQHG